MCTVRSSQWSEDFVVLLFSVGAGLSRLGLGLLVVFLYQIGAIFIRQSYLLSDDFQVNQRLFFKCCSDFSLIEVKYSWLWERHLSSKQIYKVIGHSASSQSACSAFCLAEISAQFMVHLFGLLSPLIHLLVQRAWMLDDNCIVHSSFIFQKLGFFSKCLFILFWGKLNIHKYVSAWLISVSSFYFQFLNILIL